MISRVSRVILRPGKLVRALSSTGVKPPPNRSESEGVSGVKPPLQAESGKVLAEKKIEDREVMNEADVDGGIDWKEVGEHGAIAASIATLGIEGGKFAYRYWNRRGVVVVHQSDKDLNYFIKCRRLLKKSSSVSVDSENYLVIRGFKTSFFHFLGMGVSTYYRRVQLPVGCYSDAKIEAEYVEEFQGLTVKITNFTKSESEDVGLK